MALLHIDGFDTFGTGQLNLLYATSIASITSGGRFSSSKGVVSLGTGGFITRYIGNKTTIFTGAAIKGRPLTNNNLIEFLNSSLTAQLIAKFSSNGVLSVLRGSTILGSASTIFNEDTWYYIAVKVVFSNTVGSVELWVNGVKEIDVSSVDTQATAEDGCDYVRLRGPWGTYYFDDWYISDDSGTTNNTLITEARVVPLVPTADTTQKDFTASTGSDNYAMVDEDGMDSDTTYVSTTTNGAKDIYDLGNLPAGVDTVYGIATYAFARKDNTDAVLFDFGVKSGSTESFSTGNVMASDYLGFEHVNNVDPNTSGAWSVSAVNSLQCGFTTTI